MGKYEKFETAKGSFCQFQVRDVPVLLSTGPGTTFRASSGTHFYSASRYSLTLDVRTTFTVPVLFLERPGKAYLLLNDWANGMLEIVPLSLQSNGDPQDCGWPDCRAYTKA
ncbi:hypothetical protein AVEN_26173-1 [Araneus ventricosus]|uniref:Uncharacterized protein n=1 Tax=Araneus ventricosus TaxID=182803 RepID=A0A4Y2EQ29_ARAVE|nr:hypothetical protein AVEN_26173-1 [Araneus ventricosus]